MKINEIVQPTELCVMDQLPSRKQIKEMTVRWMPGDWNGTALRVHTDTTDFFEIEYGDVVLLDGRPYLIRNSAKEGRFGLDEEIKHWVKRAIDLTHGEMCIVKLHEYVLYKFFRSDPQHEIEGVT